MADEDDPDANIFEITDFTNATLWESFIADLEGLFRQWELAKPDQVHESPSSQPQHRKTERISYSGRDFVVTLEVNNHTTVASQQDSGHEGWPTALCEMMQSSRDFPPKAHHLARWYGLSQFVVISPAERSECLHSQAQANLMLSSVSIAVGNTGCTTPVFIQLHHPWRQVYVGVCDDGRLRVEFSLTHLHHTPPQFNHLAGLLDIFKSKLQYPRLKVDPVSVAIRFMYVIKHWSLDDWPVEPLGAVDKGYDDEYLRTLRVGAFADPVKELHLSAIWPNLTEELVTDTGTYSDLNPLHSTVWTVRLQLTEQASCILAENLLNFYQLCYHSGSVAEMLGKTSLWDTDIAGTSSDSYSKPLDRLTAPGSALSSPLFHSVVYTATQRLESGYRAEENITENDVEAIMKFLFPDAYQSDQHEEQQEGGPLVYSLKAAPDNSLANKLAKVLSIVNTECGVKAMCKVWHEVTLELRWRWENGVVLPNVPEGPPNMRCCLLHQKLQMLNCCIRHKLIHSKTSTHPPHTSQTAASYSATTSSTAVTKHKVRTADDVSFHSNVQNPSPPRSNLSVHAPSRGVLQMEWKTNSAMTSDSNTLLGSEGPKEIRSDLRPQTSVSFSDSSEEEFYEALESQEEEEEEEEEEGLGGVRGGRRGGDERDGGGRRGGGGGDEREGGGRRGGGGGDGKGIRKKGTEQTKATVGIEEKLDLQTHFTGGEGNISGEGMMSTSSSGDSGESENVTNEGDIGKGEGEGEQDDSVMGRLKPCSDLILVATGNQMYIPITQDHAPLTEAHVWEQQEVLTQLGTSEEAGRLRARMQSTALMSDMQAFKAANPQCLLEDFVRWYSPRDWIEGERVQEGVEAGEVEESYSSNTKCLEEKQEVEVEKKEKEDQGEKGEEAEIEGWGEESWGGEWDVIEEEVDMVVKVGDGRREGEAGEKAEGERVEETKGEEEGTQDPKSNVEVSETVKGSSNFANPLHPSHKLYVHGHLSLRMQQPQNIWREVWSIAEPLPSHKQKKLFNDTREAEKVLHYLAGLKTAELARLVLPVLMHCAVQVLQDKHGQNRLSPAESHLQDALLLLATIQHPSLDSLPKYQEAISLLSQIEHIQAAGFSLRMKLKQGLELMAMEEEKMEGGRGREGELEASVEVLLQEPELVLQDPTSSLTGLALQGLLTAQVASRDLEEQNSIRKKIKLSTDVFPPPSGREFILRSTMPRPSPSSLLSPHRMYCVVTPQEFRLAGAFTMDTQIT